MTTGWSSILGSKSTNKTLALSCSDLRRVQVQRMEKVNLVSRLAMALSFSYIYTLTFCYHFQIQIKTREPTAPLWKGKGPHHSHPHIRVRSCGSETEFVLYFVLACGVPIDLYAECGAPLLLCSSQEQCIHALKFLPVSNWELWLWARWGILTTTFFLQPKALCSSWILNSLR